MNDIHLVRRLEKALVDDPRTHELGIRIHAHEGRIIAQGEVASDERRHRVLDVLHELEPELEITDQLTLSAEPVSQPPGREQIPGHSPPL